MGAFTYALTHGQVLAASLGYFINPLFSILLGVVFLHERLVLAEKMAVLLIFSGVCFQIWQYGELPLLALVMGSAFAVYGLIRKFIRFDVITSLLLRRCGYCLSPLGSHGGYPLMARVLSRRGLANQAAVYACGSGDNYSITVFHCGDKTHNINRNRACPIY